MFEKSSPEKPLCDQLRLGEKQSIYHQMYGAWPNAHFGLCGPEASYFEELSLPGKAIRLLKILSFHPAFPAVVFIAYLVVLLSLPFLL